MLQNRTIASILPILLGAGIVLIGCLLIAGTLFFAVAAPREHSSTTPVAALSSSTRVPTATIPPSATPTPTLTPTPMPTNTPPASNTPAPPTRPPATRIPATAVPTNTVVPTTAAPPGAAHGITFYYFNLVSNSVGRGGTAEGQIGFDFKIKNTSTQQVGYGMVGARCIDGVGNLVFFQTSWQGPDADTKLWMNPGDELEWRDWWHEGISTPGTYRMQLVICYSTPRECNSSGGDWEGLSPLVTLTVN